MENELPQWMSDLNEEDWQFIKRFILASGSLKELAGQYGISYPTIRLRLDNLIERVRILDNPAPKSRFHQKVQLMAAEGKFDFATAKSLIRLHEKYEGKG